MRPLRHDGRMLAIGYACACGPVTDAADASTAGSGSESDETTTPLECDPPSPGVDPFAGAPTCEDYLDLGSGAPQIEVRILNRTDVPIIVTNRTYGCMPTIRHFDIEGTMGSSAVRTVSDWCPEEWNACVASSGDFKGCSLCATLVPEKYIAPGGSFSETWDAWVIGDVVMPGACVDGDQPISCAAATSIAAGDFTATVHAMSLAADATECACTPDELGTCVVEPPCTFVENTTATAIYGGTCETLEIVFE